MEPNFAYISRTEAGKFSFGSKASKKFEPWSGQSCSNSGSILYVDMNCFNYVVYRSVNRTGNLSRCDVAHTDPHTKCKTTDGDTISPQEGDP